MPLSEANKKKTHDLMEPKFRLISLLFYSAHRSSRTYLSNEQPALSVIAVSPRRVDRGQVMRARRAGAADRHVGGRLSQRRRMVSIPLAKTGDSDRGQILSEYALVARNERSSRAACSI